MTCSASERKDPWSNTSRGGVSTSTHFGWNRPLLPNATSLGFPLPTFTFFLLCFTDYVPLPLNSVHQHHRSKTAWLTLHAGVSSCSSALIIPSSPSTHGLNLPPLSLAYHSSYPPQASFNVLVPDWHTSQDSMPHLDTRPDATPGLWRENHIIVTLGLQYVCQDSRERTRACSTKIPLTRCTYSPLFRNLQLTNITSPEQSNRSLFWREHRCISFQLHCRKWLWSKLLDVGINGNWLHTYNTLIRHVRDRTNW